MKAITSNERLANIEKILKSIDRKMSQDREIILSPAPKKDERFVPAIVGDDSAR